MNLPRSTLRVPLPPKGALIALRVRLEISCAFVRRIRDAMPGVERAVWHCHTSDSQQRSAPEAGETNVQVIAERALSAAGRAMR